MFILQLNDMRSANVENLTAVIRAETKEDIEVFIDKEKVENYLDGQWSKSYRKNSMLEWFNPPYNFEQHIVDVGTEHDWAENAKEQFNEQVMRIPIA